MPRSPSLRPSFVALALLAALPSADALAREKEFSCFPTSQIKLGCHYLLKNTRNQIRDLGARVWAAIRNRPTPQACEIDLFNTMPELWRNLEVARGTRGPSYENQLAVHNKDAEMASVCSQEIGSCWGQASVKQHFSYGAFYDPEAKFAALPDAAVGSRKWKNYYVRIMQNIMDGEATLIPGFKGMYEMSSHPDLIEEFKKLVIIAWGKRLAKLENLKLMTIQYTGPKGSVEFVQNVQRRLALGQMPKIVFSYNAGGSVGKQMRAKLLKMKEAHIVLALETYPLNGNRTLIKVWDDKKSVPHTTELLIVDHDTGLASFMPWTKDVKDAKPNTLPPTSTYLAIAKEQDGEYRKLALSIAALCEKHPGLCVDRLEGPAVRISRPQLPDGFGDLRYADAE